MTPHVMTFHFSRRVLSVTCALILLIAGWSIARHEHTLRHGEIVLLELAPVDPRSLMQGDYMALAFAIDRTLNEAIKNTPDARFANLRRDAQGRATFSELTDQPNSGNDVISLRLRRHGTDFSLGPNAFFFQEGQAHAYEKAHWGEFRVAQNGTALLTHLRDAALQRIDAQNSSQP